MKSETLLVEYSRVLAYEWGMLHECHEWLTDHASEEYDVVHNALVEARLVHTRSLLEFFFNKKPYSTDIHFWRWFVDGSDEHTHFTGSKQRDSCWQKKSRIDRHIAHMTSERVRECAQRFDRDIIPQIDALMIEFTQYAGERVCPELVALAKKLDHKPVTIGSDSTSGNTRNPRTMDGRP